jgi:hypothetical protein
MSLIGEPDPLRRDMLQVAPRSAIAGEIGNPLSSSVASR